MGLFCATLPRPHGALVSPGGCHLPHLDDVSSSIMKLVDRIYRRAISRTWPETRYSLYVHHIHVVRLLVPVGVVTIAITSETRSQAIARIADRTASQQTLVAIVAK